MNRRVARLIGLPGLLLLAASNCGRGDVCESDSNCTKSSETCFEGFCVVGPRAVGGEGEGEAPKGEGEGEGGGEAEGEGEGQEGEGAEGEGAEGEGAEGEGEGEGELLAASADTPTIGERPIALAVGDFDGDGTLDRVVANQDSSNLVLLFGHPAGPPPLLSSCGGPTSVAVADLNRDGALDIVVVCPISDQVLLLSGNGDGGFPQISSLAMAHPVAVAIADFDGNGALDLAVALDNGAADDVNVYAGDGSGSFLAPPRVLAIQTLPPADATPSAVVAADVNRDGRPDLLVADAVSRCVVINLANPSPDGGAISFGGPSSVATGSNPRAVAAADLDDDGALDFVVANQGGSTVSLFFGDSDGTFPSPPPNELAVGEGPSSLALGDLDGDGVLDIAVANVVAESVSILLGRGARAFAPATSISVGGAPQSVVLADLDDDGSLDVALVNQTAAAAMVLTNNSERALGDFAFATFPRSDDSDGNVVAALVRDFTRDGRADVVVVNEIVATVTLAAGDGGGGFSARIVGAGVDVPSALAAADFNRDGRLDLVIAHAGSGQVSILLGEGDGTDFAFAAATPFPCGLDPVSVAVGDFNRDGKSDLVCVNRAAAGAISLLNGTGDGDFDVGAAPISVVAEPIAIAIADVDGDGCDDLMVAGDGLSVLLGRQDGGFAEQPRVLSGVSLRSVAVGDVDDNGALDLVLTREQVDEGIVVTILPGDGSGSFVDAGPLNLGLAAQSLALADLDHDGQLDLAVGNGAGLSLFLGVAGGGFEPRGSQVASSNIALVTGDFDGNGALDILSVGGTGISVVVQSGVQATP